MKVAELCEHIRTNKEPLRVDNVTVNTGTEVLHGHGTIRVGKNRFKLRLSLSGGECPLPHGVFTREQFWKIAGVIDDETPFNTVGLPHSAQSGFSDLAFSRADFDVDSISLGRELTESEQREREKQGAEMRHMFGNGMAVSDTAPKSATSNERLRYQARLISYPLIWKNSVTETNKEAPGGRKSRKSSWDTLHTSFEGCEFTLTQDGEDCLIDVRPLAGTEIEVTRLDALSTSFLYALGFVSGRDAWPQDVKVSTPFKTVKHTLKVPRESRKSDSALLTDTACANGADFADALQCATVFFLNKAQLGADVNELLFLSRSATSSQTPHEVGTLALCSIFEGMVDHLDEALLSEVEHEHEAVFDEAKKTLLAACNELKGGLPANSTNLARSYERLAGSVGAARFARFKDKLERLVAHLGLPWANCFDLALSAWQKNRNSLAHGKLASRSLELDSQSRMAGAINLLVAAAMGYKGLAVFSRGEDRYQRI